MHHEDKPIFCRKSPEFTVSGLFLHAFLDTKNLLLPGSHDGHFFWSRVELAERHRMTVSQQYADRHAEHAGLQGGLFDMLKCFETNELLHLRQVFESVGLGLFQDRYPLAVSTC